VRAVSITFIYPISSSLDLETLPRDPSGPKSHRVDTPEHGSGPTIGQARLSDD